MYVILTEEDNMTKPVKILCIVLGALIGVILLFFIGLKVGEKIRYHSFYQNAEKTFQMPGVSDNLVQQGMVYVEEKNVFLVCGYMSDDTSSRVYVVSEDGDVLSITELRNEDGSEYLGHTGGIEYYENCLYITEGTKEKEYDGGLDVFPLDEVLAGAERVTKRGRIKTYNNPAYCHIEDGYLLVGEFYREIDYETVDSHRIQTPCGDQNNALLTVFRLDDSEFHVSGAPIAGITTQGLVQGMCITEEHIILSTSWSISSSHLYFYEKDKVTQTPSVTIDGNTMPLYHLDSTCLAETVELPPMSEEIVYHKGDIYILCESACNKYIYGKFMSGNHLYRYHYDSPK